MNQHRPLPDAALLRRRAAFCSRVARARLVPACRRGALLREAATIARRYHTLTGVPLFTDVADQLCAVDTARCARCGLHPAAVSACATGEAAYRPCSDDTDGTDDEAATVPPIALDAAHIAAWLRDEAG